MKWLLWTALGLIGLVGVVACIGWLLPVGHEASRSEEFSKPPDVVYALVADVKNYPQWWKDTTQVDMLVDEANRTTFRQHTSTGPIVMTVTERVPPSRFVTKIDDPGQPFGGTWTWEIAPTSSGGARLTITERGEIYNPIFRFMARFVFGYTATIDSCLTAMKTRLG
jgi:ribosome-associated toxin RatA of RatAB toxin-antitoxin module